MNKFFEQDFVISGIRLCCKVRDETGTTVHRNRASHGLVLFVKGGSEFEFLRGKTVHLKEGQLIYLPKFSDYNSTDTSGAVCIAINFDLAEEGLTFPPFSLNESFGEKYRPMFEKLLQMWQKQRVGYLNGCLGMLYTIIYHIQADAIRQYQVYGHGRMAEQCAYYINDHITEASLSVEEMADFAKVSPTYLRRIFKDKYGVSPKEYILLRRLDMAKAMIEYGDIKLSCIPFECGFTEYPYFSRMFKKRMGIAPLQYQKKVRTGKAENDEG